MSKLTLCTLDFESFWSTTHTLSKMSPIEYVTHPEPELISLSFKFGADKTYCIFGEDKIANWASQVDWSELLVVGHNMSRFDSMILAWRLGVRPGMWGCTLSMATPHHAKTCGLSLGALVEHYGLGKKDNSALINTRGKHLKEFTADEIARMRAYNIADTDQCYALFKRPLKVTPSSEMKLIDHTIRMLVEPQFEVDRPLLAETLVLERERKEKVLLDLAKLLDPARAHADPDGASLVVEKMLRSAAKFADFLRNQGVEVPMKLSQRTGKWAPALARTDEAFLELQEHENELVAEAAAARLGVKSTILESRLSAFITASDAVGGRLPITLKYYGADTTGRWSGWAYNPQNLPRISPDKPKLSDVTAQEPEGPQGQKGHRRRLVRHRAAGKSTIAKAIVSYIRGDGKLNELIPFKSRGKTGTESPKVEGIDGLSSALVFDEDYVNQFVFQQDEVIKNSFDIFIKTSEYVTTMTEIEELFAGIKKALADTAEIEQTTKDLKELRDAFGSPNKDGSIPKTSKLIKAYGSGNKIENIPESLKPFETFIKSPDPSKWIGWQIKGNEFLNLGDTCPYCSTALPAGPQKETALAVAKEYDEKAVSHLNALKAVIERLGKYFSFKCQENLETISFISQTYPTVNFKYRTYHASTSYFK